MKKPAAKTKLVAYPALLNGIATLVDESRHAVVRAANCFMTATYWEVGRRIVEFEQGGKRRAEYGDELLKRLAEDLTARHGRGFGWRNLASMKLFFLSYSKILQTLSAKLGTAFADEILQTLSAKSSSLKILPTVSEEFPTAMIQQTPSEKFTTGDWIEFLRALAARFPLPWSHYVKLLTVKDENARRFYEEEALRGGWSVRQLDRQIGSLFYERTLLSKDKATMLRKGGKPQTGDALSVDEAMRDPLVLEFLNLRDEYSESDLEDALVRHLETFLLELGGDFTFVGRQRRLRVGNKWYRVDLIFYHRRLRCLVIIDLKLGTLDHADAGQIYPVRYVLLRLRPAKQRRREFLRRLHQRPETSNQRAQRRPSSLHERPSPDGARLLRGVSQPRGCNQTREVSQDGVGQTLHQRPTRRLSHGVNLYLSYAREHWTHEGENPPVGIILCSAADEALARYTLDTLPNKVMAREYQLALPAVKKLEAELAATRKRLERASQKK